MAARRRRTSGLDGYVVVDKDPGMTSHDVVARLRRQLGEGRIGHAGTLDPDATGVLVVAIGRATRLMRFMSGADKAYVGEVVLGQATSTLDSSGEVTARFEMDAVTEDEVRAAAATLTGAIEQIPPMVSAVRVGGKRLYELARSGEEIERAPRSVEVKRFDVEATGDPLVYRIAVECSSGTFVRSLAADLGSALGGGAHLRALRRTRVGPFPIEQAQRLDAIGRDSIAPAIGLLSGLDAVALAPELDDAVRHGKVLDPSVLGATGDGPWSLVSPTGELLAVYERFGAELVKPTVVLGAPGEPE